MYNVFVPEGADRASVMRTLDAAGVETRPLFYPMHQLPPYESTEAFPVADEWSARGISLPMHERLTESDIDRIAVALELALADL
jgi:perosamine synthetase